MATVTNTIKLPDGSTPSHAAAVIELVASTTTKAAGWVTATDVTILSKVRPTVTNGAWTASLTPNADITPSGTVYKITETADRQQYVHYISVGSGGGTVHDLLVDPPASLASAASEAYTDAAIAALNATGIAFTPTTILTDDTVAEVVTDISLRFGPGPIHVRQHPTTFIERFQSGHGWTVEAGSGSGVAITNDSLDVVLGSQSISFPAASNNSISSVGKSGYSFDATGYELTITLKIDNPDLITEFYVYAADSTFANFWSWTLLDPNEDFPIRVIKAGEWQTITLPWAAAIKSGSPTKTLQRFRVRIRCANGNTTTVHLNGIGAREAASWPDGVVSITFDDVYSSLWTTARPIMDAYGFSGVIYTIADYVGPQVSLANMRNLQDHSGWQVSCHGPTNLTTLTLEQAEANIVYNQRFLLDNGFYGWNHYSWPNGAFTADIENLVARRFASARTVYGTTGAAGGFESARPTSPYRLRARAIGGSDATSGITARLDRAQADGSWLILVFHDIVPTVSTGIQYSTSNFTTIIDYINSIGIPVRTVEQVLGV